jgi:hypothetical protein
MSTCLVIMNREGVAIAADSAVTIGSLNIMNTADKIVQLHNYPNAGVVFSDTAEYMNNPIKTMIQMFDKSLANHITVVKSMRELSDLFIDFLAHYPFTESNVRRFLKQNIYYYLDEVFEKDFTIEAIEIAQSKLEAPEDKKRSNQLRKLIENSFSDIVQELIEDRGLNLTSNETILLQKHLVDVFVSGHDYNDSVNIIFAGYGTNQLTPSMYEIYLYGQVGSNVLYEELNDKEVSNDYPLGIFKMAQSEIIDLMEDGISMKLLRSMNRDRLDQLIKYFKSDSGDSPLKDRAFLAFLEEESEKIRIHIESEAVSLTERHWYPLLRGLRMQTIASLANYAEILVSISILNSRYTRDGDLFQTVGGPVDVATITLVDGFQWRQYKGNHGK